MKKIACLVLSFIACGAPPQPTSNDDLAFGATRQALSTAWATLADLQGRYPGAFAAQNKFGRPSQSDAIVTQPGIRGEWPEFLITDNDTFAYANYGYAEKTQEEFAAYVANVAHQNATTLLEDLQERFPHAFSDVRKFGTPKQGDVIVVKPGVRGEWPEFVLVDAGFESLNYGGTYARMLPDAFAAFVEEVAEAVKP